MESNINDIVERDWGEDEIRVVERAEDEVEERINRFFSVVWNSIVVILIVVLSVVLCWMYFKCRELRATERDRALEACPGGTALRVMDEVNREPGVAFCNRVADKVFGL